MEDKYRKDKNAISQFVDTFMSSEELKGQTEEMGYGEIEASKLFDSSEDKFDFDDIHMDSLYNSAEDKIKLDDIHMDNPFDSHESKVRLDNVHMGSLNK